MYCRPVLFRSLNRISDTIQVAQGRKYFSPDPQATREPSSGLINRNNGYPIVYRVSLETHTRVLYCYLEHNNRSTREVLIIQLQLKLLFIFNFTSPGMFHNYHKIYTFIQHIYNLLQSIHRLHVSALARHPIGNEGNEILLTNIS